MSALEEDVRKIKDRLEKLNEEFKQIIRSTGGVSRSDEYMNRREFQETLKSMERSIDRIDKGLRELEDRVKSLEKNK